jgi:ribosomal protein L15
MSTLSFTKDIKVKSDASVKRLAKVLDSETKSTTAKKESRNIDRNLKEGVKLFGKYFSRSKIF